ncbi:hypothetical protein N8344_00420 [bacterium]|nr:hypothetical protein [bacterium]
MFKLIGKLIKWSVIVAVVGTVVIAIWPKDENKIANCIATNGEQYCDMFGTELDKQTVDAKIAKEKAEKDAELQRQREQEEQRIADSQEKRRKGFHCLSAWDGSHRGVVKFAKTQLRDPKSFEHDSTSVWPVDANGNHQLVMQYRAKNGFGGMSSGVVKAEFSNDTCGAIVKSID